ncbi:DNA repair protein RecN [soil metagenome]
MLEELRIVDVGVIQEVTLELVGGLNVLTGETGAGKTMVVSSLELLLGARADADAVRTGAARAIVEGRIRPAPAGAVDWLDEADDDLVVARGFAADGGGTRSRARLGGRLAPVSALTEVVGAVVEVHGQSESARLGDTVVQRGLLDRSGGPALASAYDSYQATHEAWRAAQRELADLRAGARDRARELDRISFELAEIDAVEPQPGEEEKVDAELARLEHAEGLIAAAGAAAAALTDDGGGRDALGAAVGALRGIAGVDPALDALHERAEGLAAEAQDLGIELGSYAQSAELDPARLSELRDRRGALGQLARKFGADAEAICAYAQAARERFALLSSGEDRAAALAEEVQRLAARVAEAGEALRQARRSAGDRLSERVAAHLAELAMAGAVFRVELEPVEPGPYGTERVTFLLAANTGESPLPLAKAASGGERSRIALAVRLALADADATPVLVFDEVDVGIGGAVAIAVGRKLAALAQGRQVVCVTHLAQLAAFADAHFSVEKATAGARTVATVRRLDDDERVTELSRMLSGSPDSALATGHAAELLAAARAARPE